jgi:hypothetical protein
VAVFVTKERSGAPSTECGWKYIHKVFKNSSGLFTKQNGSSVSRACPG